MQTDSGAARSASTGCFYVDVNGTSGEWSRYEGTVFYSGALQMFCIFCSQTFEVPDDDPDIDPDDDRANLLIIGM